MHLMFDLTALMTCSKHRQQCRAAGAVSSPLPASAVKGTGQDKLEMKMSDETSDINHENVCSR